MEMRWPRPALACLLVLISQSHWPFALETGRNVPYISHLLAFQSKKDPPVWTCPFHPPLQLYFIIHNMRQLRDFGLAKIKVRNYWTADGVSGRPGILTAHSVVQTLSSVPVAWFLSL